MSTSSEFTEQDMMRRLRRDIDNAEGICTYDYRPEILPGIAARAPHIMDSYCVYIGSIRYAIASVLKPRNIFEVGIGWGLAARAFLAAQPEANYFGIDDESMGISISEALSGLPTAKWLKCDSDKFEFAHPDGPIDLIHVDGCHTREHEARDIISAVQSGAQWMLVDDFHEKGVLAAFGDAMATCWGPQAIPMIYFERSTSCMLVHTGAYK